jgi:hypothetical protein
MAAAFQINRLEALEGSWKDGQPVAKVLQLPEFAGVFRGRELTRKDRRLSSGLRSIDELIGGGIVRGRVSEITGAASSGKTSLAVSFVAAATGRGEVAAWIAAANDFDPQSFVAANVNLERVLWVSCGGDGKSQAESSERAYEAIASEGEARASKRKFVRSAGGRELKAAEWLLAAGGLGLVLIDFGVGTRVLPQSAALRLARAAERSGTAVIVIAARRICGTFAALSLGLRRDRACFSRPRANAPILFDGMVIEAQVTRNKLGGSGHSATWRTAIDPASAFTQTHRREGGSQRMIGNSAAY